jgi:hypothetical protein
MYGRVETVPFAEVALGFLNNFTHQVGLILRIGGNYGDHQTLGVGAIRIKFEGLIHQPESFLEIVCLQGVIGEFLGAPLGVVLFPGSSQLGKATATGQLR